MKLFNIKYNVGRCKYLVSYHNGIATHKDGSRFFDIAPFKNKVKLNRFVGDLVKDGYKYTY
jgi:hypothetical protein